MAAWQTMSYPNCNTGEFYVGLFRYCRLTLYDSLCIVLVACVRSVLVVRAYLKTNSDMFLLSLDCSICGRLPHNSFLLRLKLSIHFFIYHNHPLPSTSLSIPFSAVHEINMVLSILNAKGIIKEEDVTFLGQGWFRWA